MMIWAPNRNYSMSEPYLTFTAHNQNYSKSENYLTFRAPNRSQKINHFGHTERTVCQLS